MKKQIYFLSIFLLTLISFTNVNGQYNGLGTFTKITSLDDLTDGYYVITNESDDNLMTNTRSGNYFDRKSVSPNSNSIENPSISDVWLIETNGTGKTIYNEEIEKYVGWRSSNSASADDTPSDNSRWVFTYSQDKFTAANVATSSRKLSYNSSSPRFAAYTSNQKQLQLYKLEEEVVVELPPIVSPSTQNGTVDQEFSYQIEAIGTPTSYAIVSGTLPNGITLDTASGLLSGTPTEGGTFTINVTATNEYGTSEEATIILEIIDMGDICGIEDFGNVPTASSTSYNNRSWEGFGGEWTATDSRADQSIDGASITVRDGALTSPILTGGIGSLTLSTQRAFSGGSGNLTVKVNGNTVGTIPYDDTLQTTTIPNINVAGNVTIVIEAPGSDRIIMDNLTWTCYDAPEECPTTTTWDGSVWSNGEPTFATIAIIAGEYVVNTNLEACGLEVTADGSLTIATGNSITLGSGEVINNAAAANFVVESGASLIQLNDEVVNTGNITVKRNSAPMVRQDYTRWGAPVTGQNLKAFSPNTLNNRFYTLNGTAFTSIDPTTNSFEPGIGVSIRADNTYPSNEYTTFEGVFVGVPNNGEFIIPTEGEYTLLGNPYPSPIDAGMFFNFNNNYSTLYFWTHTTPTQSGGGYDGANNYATYTRLGETTTADYSDEVPNGIIQVGQGFMVKGGAGTSAIFNGEMRIADATLGVFFKNETEKNRIWLSIADENQKLSQALIGYVDGATEGVDKQIDGKLFAEDTATTLFTLIDDEKYAIEGRGEFSVEDVFTLGYKAAKDGTYTIALDKQDGLFANGQTVYLRDIATQNVHNLSESNYTFTTQSGEFTNAFEIVFQEDGALGVSNALAQNDVIIYQNNQTVNIQSKDIIKNVELFDMTGRKVLLKTNVNSNKVSLTTQSLAKQVLVVKVTTINGKVVTQKVINK